MTESETVRRGVKRERGLRLTYLDGLRGIAAIGVLFHHMLHGTVMEPVLRQGLPSFVAVAMKYGARGVEVFFVLSGFVLLHSLQQTRLDRRGTWRFIGRRQLRLDPCYWVVLIATLGYMVVRQAIPALTSPALPAAHTVVANFAYAQKITGQPQIVGVAWTLCLEIQFYLVLLVLLGLPRWLGRHLDGPDAGRRWVPWALVGSGLASILVAHAGSGNTWFWDDWRFFAAGAITWCCLNRRLHPLVLVTYLGLLIGGTLGTGPVPLERSLSALLAVGVVIAGAKVPAFAAAMGRNRLLQYLGSRSYAIYLVHTLVLSLVLEGAYKVTGDNVPAALVAMVMATALSLAAAEALHRLVERPSLEAANAVRQGGWIGLRQWAEARWTLRLRLRRPLVLQVD